MSFIQQAPAPALRSAAVMAVCVLCGAALLLPLHFSGKVPPFVFRKLMHTVAFTAATLMLLLASDWPAPVTACCAGALCAWPVLTALERRKWYAGLLVEKHSGEVKRSLCLFFLTTAAVAAIAWGAAGSRASAAAAVLMWGTGDAAAALIGIPFGKHKLRWKPADGKKSLEGSAAMFTSAFLSGSAALLALSDRGAGESLLTAFAGAAAAAFTELLSKNGADTVTVPLVVTAALCLPRLL